jgi:transcription-repair coupling factor (superfamily II helicase)
MRELLRSSFIPFINTIQSAVGIKRKNRPSRDVRIFNLRGSSQSLYVALMMLQNPNSPHIVVTTTEEEAEVIRKDVHFYLSILEEQTPGVKSPLFLPDQGDEAATGERLRSILAFQKGTVLVGSLSAFFSPTFSPGELLSQSLDLEPEGSFERREVVSKLQSIGYREVALVSAKGQYSNRSWILDVFPPDREMPVRVEFFGDEIERIRAFEIDTQRSQEELKRVTLLPSQERTEGKTFVEHLEPETFCYIEEGTENISESRQHDSHRLKDALSRLNTTYLHEIRMEGADSAPTLPLHGMGLLFNERTDIYGLSQALLKRDEQIVFVLSGAAQRERLNEILHEGGIVAPLIGVQSLPKYSGRVAIAAGHLAKGLHIEGLIILTEREIFGRKPPYKRHHASKIKKLLDSLEDLKVGDYIVHRDHGIGRFSGLIHLKTKGHEGETMFIEYAEGAKLYLPLQYIGLIQKYRAEDSVIPPLDRLGGKLWKKKKERARRKVREFAKKLLSLYAERGIFMGHAFSPDTYLHREFEEFFPFEETPDQVKAWKEIKKDMESSHPMDRLLCGDVGFGKTEVAMRASFKAACDQKQVAVLVPTTILCEQHYRNFQARFSAFPVNIDFLSRFKSPSETKKTVEALRYGETDIVIGTHALLGKKIQFLDLGLLIIDEEHRFGVHHKERIKELKKRVDCLSMSATPIPRTLEMSLSGIREMSLIETPPEERLAIKSIVATFNDQVIREAIGRELDRKGQVFFVHNRVSEIERMKDSLTRMFPMTKIAIAHGQMRESALEEVMLQLMNEEIDILLSTSIIGSGIDIPTANTIIVNRADRMGLSDLYQLKGRVGRSNIKAYSYFLVPPPHLLTDEARRRMVAIEELNYLGAGLRLAMKDLEIRGAGNLLGAEQSGHIHAVGFEMYMEMLQQEVAALKGLEVREEREPSIDLNIEAHIPETYIGDMTMRLGLYRRLSLCHTEDEIRSLRDEIDDRFGLPPPPVMSLLEIVEIKILSRRLSIISLVSRDGTIKVRFSMDTPVSLESLLDSEKKHHGRFHFTQEGFSLRVESPPEKDLTKSLREVLAGLRAEDKDGRSESERVGS